jgi:hypothetical protein
LKKAKAVSTITAIVFILLSLTTIRVARATTIFSDSFDTGDFSQWTGARTSSGTPAITSSVYNTPPYCAQFTVTKNVDNGSCCEFVTKSYGTTEDVRYYFMFPSTPTVDTSGILSCFYNTTGNDLWLDAVAVWYTASSNTWQFQVSSSATGDGRYHGPTTAVRFTPGMWYYLEQEYTVGSSGNLKLWLDGANVLSWTGNMGTTVPNAFFLGWEWYWSGSVPFTIYIDDVVIANNYIGPITTPITPAPANATIRVDAYNGTEAVTASTTCNGITENTPCSFAVHAGTYTITCTYNGISKTSNVTVSAGETREVDFQFGTGPETTVFVSPKESNVEAGQTFTVNITITDVSGLVGFDFHLSYNTSILTLVSVELGPFLSTAGGDTFLINKTTSGQIWLAACLYQPTGWTGISANGTGVLANATFKATAPGESPLDLFSENPYNPDAVQLVKDPTIGAVPIPNVAISGSVVVSPDPPPTPIISVASLTASKSVVAQGYSLQINATVDVHGGSVETFNVTAYANGTAIATKEITMMNGTSTTITFTWNTTGFAYGNYTISAYAWPVPGETNPANNNRTGGTVKVTIPGDANGDGVVDAQDFYILERAWGTSVGQKNYDPRADFNGDGVVDAQDFFIMEYHWRQSVAL